MVFSRFGRVAVLVSVLGLLAFFIIWHGGRSSTHEYATAGNMVCGVENLDAYPSRVSAVEDAGPGLVAVTFEGTRFVGGCPWFVAVGGAGESVPSVGDCFVVRGRIYTWREDVREDVLAELRDARPDVVAALVSWDDVLAFGVADEFVPSVESPRDEWPCAAVATRGISSRESRPITRFSA